MDGKTCVITGATSGIGLEAAAALARRGASLILVGRSRERGAAALERLRARVPQLRATLLHADLSRLAEVRRLAGEVLDAAPRIDVLVNNAGAFFDSHALTADGLERTFALNHMSYFVLTNLLLARLEASTPSRIVMVASEAHRGIALDFADLAGTRGAKGWPAYRRSKLANILFTRELARRLAGRGIGANCLHPGFVATGFAETAPNRMWTRIGIRIAKRFAAITPAEGGGTIVHLATSREGGETAGAYFVKHRAAPPSAEAQDEAAARRLWDESARIAGLPPDRAAMLAGEGG